MNSYSVETEKVDAYTAKQLDKHQPYIQELRQFILSSHPIIKELFRYKLPMYKLHKNICFLHVLSKTNELYIGFMKGAEMVQLQSELKTVLIGDQKLVRRYYIKPNQSIQYDELGKIIDLAIELDS